MLNSIAFVNGGDGAPRNRPSLAQAFEQTRPARAFVVDVNHLKSKGSACDAPDAGDGQGNCNAVRDRTAATALAAWLAGDPTGTGDPDVLIVGDYNSYAKEDPISDARRTPATPTSIARGIGADAYSYVFDGQWGYLDYALGIGRRSARRSTGVAEWHINADEPSVLDYNTEFKTAGQVASLYAPDQFRISDHDPVIVGLTPNSPPTVTAAFEDASVSCGAANASLAVDVQRPRRQPTPTRRPSPGVTGRASPSPRRPRRSPVPTRMPRPVVTRRR